MDNNDIKTFVEEIAINTGLKFSAYTDKGVSVCDGEPLKNIDVDFPQFKRDNDAKVTLFRFKFKNKDYIGEIKGEKGDCSALSYLISEIAEKTSHKESAVRKEEFFKSVLLGEASFYNIKKYVGKFGIKDKPVCVMLISVLNQKSQDVAEAVKNYSGSDQDVVCELEDGALAFIKFQDDAQEEYRSVAEYAEFLLQFIAEETGENCGIFIGGTVKGINDLSTSFSQAVATERMSGIYGKKTGVHSYKEFVVVKIVEDLPKHKLNEYLETLFDPSAKEIFEDEDMILTAESFLDNNLNVSETSRKLYLHRNTLNYRLDKIEKYTGLNLRKMSDAITFRLITVLLKTLR